MSQITDIQLMPMSEATFEEFKIASMDYYSKDRAKAEDIALEHVKQVVEKQFEQMNELRRQTPNQFYFDIVIVATGERIGHLWLGLAKDDSGTILRINDIFIYELMRSKGYGRKVLELAECEAKKHKASKITLHAFHHNQRAVHLYEAVGFQTVSLVMAKNIS